MPIVILIGSEEDFLKSKGRQALTTSEAQAKLKLQARAFTSLIDKGEITPYEERLGNYQLFDAQEVEELRQRRLKRF